MSNLNYNNIDVQRMLNVLKEIFLKFSICSFLSYNNLSENLSEIKNKITDEELSKDLEDHYEAVKNFKEKHIEIEVVNDNDKNSEEEEEAEEEGQGKEKELVKKEIQDLKEINEFTSDITKILAKSTRNFCRKYYRNKEFQALVFQYQNYDPDISSFITKFADTFLPYYQKKTKMTLEEEESETKLNTILNQKISELKEQIAIKKKKYEKLKNERNIYKADCQKKINDITTEIATLKNKTKEDLNKLAQETNKKLNDAKEENDEALKNLEDECKKVNDEFKESRIRDNLDEKNTVDIYIKNENSLGAQINSYDLRMSDLKANTATLNKEKEKLIVDLNTFKTELNTVENKYKILNYNFLLTQQKYKDVAYDNEVKERAVEWIQGQVRGFFTRKQLRKKYKFLNVLRAPKIIPIVEDPKAKKGKKTK